MPPEPIPAADTIYRTEDIRTLHVPDTFYGLLDAICHRPGMFIGQKSLRDFRSWLHGYQSRWVYTGASPSAEEEDFRAFDSFVCEKYSWHDTGGWAAKIAYYHRDDADALDQFFKLLDEFRAAKSAR